MSFFILILVLMIDNVNLPRTLIKKVGSWPARVFRLPEIYFIDNPAHARKTSFDLAS